MTGTSTMTIAKLRAYFAKMGVGSRIIIQTDYDADQPITVSPEDLAKLVEAARSSGEDIRIIICSDEDAPQVIANEKKRRK